MIKETNEQQTAIIIEINELNYTYPGTEQPLWEKNLTFVLRKGEIVGLAGQNGRALFPGKRAAAQDR